MRRFPLALLFLLLLTSFTFARDAKEDARIEYLLHSVAELDGAKFIRNGTEYDAAKAVSHLRLKLGKAGDRVKTAEDFIEGLASKSSLSGKPYTIRRADGKTVETSTFFHQKLQEYDTSH